MANTRQGKHTLSIMNVELNRLFSCRRRESQLNFRNPSGDPKDKTDLLVRRETVKGRNILSRSATQRSGFESRDLKPPGDLSQKIASPTPDLNEIVTRVIDSRNGIDDGAIRLGRKQLQHANGSKTKLGES